MNQLPSEGVAPCFLAIGPDNTVFCANYSAGSVTVFSTDPADGRLLDSTTLMLPGAADVVFDSGACEGRQEAAHAHCLVPDVLAGQTGLAFACDLGSNEVVTLKVRSSLLTRAGRSV